MLYERKTKDKKQISIVLFPLTAIIIFITLMATIGIPPAFYTMGAIFLVASTFPLLTAWRTRNSGYLVLALFQLSAAMACFTAPTAIEDRSQKGLTLLFVVIMYASMLVTFYLTINRKLKWRGQEVFELAAMPIEDTSNNYTSRPRPTGQTEVSKTEMIRFVDFITTHLIAFAFHEENRVVFVPTLPGNDLPYLLGLRKDYLKDTWVAIDFDGNVSVNITEEDYLLFKQDLNFDQLCESLGSLFIEFLELSKQGQEQRIIDKMNALRLFPLG